MRAHSLAPARLRLAPFVLVVATAAALVAGPVPAAHAAAYAVANRYAIVGGNGKVVDAANWGTTNFTPAQMWDFRTSGNVLNQRWDFVARDSGYYEFRNANPAPDDGVNVPRCLDESAPVNGADVYLYTCTHAANQQWIFENYSGVNYRLRNRQDGRCLDIKNWDQSNGARLGVWDCTGDWNQAFHGLYTG